MNDFTRRVTLYELQKIADSMAGDPDLPENANTEDEEEKARDIEVMKKDLKDRKKKAQKPKKKGVRSLLAEGKVKPTVSDGEDTREDDPERDMLTEKVSSVSPMMKIARASHMANPVMRLRKKRLKFSKPSDGFKALTKSKYKWASQ